MTLRVLRAPAVAANTAFQIVVPGQEVWTLVTVAATLSRGVGGTPNRSLLLTITDGTNTVVTSPAADAGTEPGILSATWANAQPAAVSSGGTGITLGPLPTALTLLPGYVITGTVVSGVVTDQWTLAVAWYDERPS